MKSLKIALLIVLSFTLATSNAQEPASPSIGTAGKAAKVQGRLYVEDLLQLAYRDGTTDFMLPLRPGAIVSVDDPLNVTDAIPMFYAGASGGWKRLLVFGDVSTPPLQEVLTAGNIMTGDIQTGSTSYIQIGDVADTYNGSYIKLGGNVGYASIHSGSGLDYYFSGLGIEADDPGTNITGRLSFVGLTADQIYTFPNASGTVALTSDIAVTSLTTTGTSGSATLIGGVLNIPYIGAAAPWNGFFNGTSANSFTTTLSGNGSLQMIFTGVNPQTWTMPDQVTYSNRAFFIKNESSATLTVQRGGSDQLFTDVAVNSIEILPGESRLLMSGASYWHVHNTPIVNSLTTTGTSGTATLIGGVLNIPNYGLSNFYNLDGTLSGARNVNSNSNNLTFSNTSTFGIYDGAFATNRFLVNPTQSSITSPNGVKTISVTNSGVQASLISNTTANIVYYDPGPGLLTYGAAPTSTFVGLTDGPGVFTGQALKSIRVNAGENALEYYTPTTTSTLANTYVGFGNASNVMTGSNNLKFVDATKALTIGGG